MCSWGTGTECDDDCNSTVSEQRYLNTTITLEAADPTFGTTVSSAGGATYTKLQSSQGGKVWHIEEIVVPPVVSK